MVESPLVGWRGVAMEKNSVHVVARARMMFVNNWLYDCVGRVERDYRGCLGNRVGRTETNMGGDVCWHIPRIVTGATGRNVAIEPGVMPMGEAADHCLGDRLEHGPVTMALDEA